MKKKKLKKSFLFKNELLKWMDKILWWKKPRNFQIQTQRNGSNKRYACFNIEKNKAEKTRTKAKREVNLEAQASAQATEKGLNKIQEILGKRNPSQTRQQSKSDSMMKLSAILGNML